MNGSPRFGLILGTALLLVVPPLVRGANAKDVPTATEKKSASPSDFESETEAEPMAGAAPLTVKFSADSNNAVGRVKYFWDFDDGTTTTDQNPTHTFKKARWYIVSLKSTDAAGHTYLDVINLRAWKPDEWAAGMNRETLDPAVLKKQAIKSGAALIKRVQQRQEEDAKKQAGQSATTKVPAPGQPGQGDTVQ